MAKQTITGTGTVTSSEVKSVKWEGLTKGGKAVTITLSNAMNMGNIDWTFAEKADTVAQIVFTALYSNSDSTSTSNVEPWSIEIDDTITEGASEIMLGAGKFYIGTDLVALTRGGGQFTVEREYREINADGDRGPVSGRVVMDASRATLTMNVLTILTNMSDLYGSISIS